MRAWNSKNAIGRKFQEPNASRHVDALYRQADLSIRGGDLNDARQFLARLISCENPHAKGYGLYAMVMEALGHREQARKL